MGKKAVFVRSRQKDFRLKKELRQKRSDGERAKRLGNDDTARQIARVAVKKAPPTDADKAILLAQFAQACRITDASEELCTVIRATMTHKEGDAPEGKPPANGAKRSREKATSSESTGSVDLTKCIDALLALYAVSEEESPDGGPPLPTLDDIITDECGCRVVNTLLHVANEVGHSKVTKLNDAVLSLFDADEALVRHYIACRSLSTIASYATDVKVKHRVLKILQRASSGSEAHVGTEVLKDRHTSFIVLRLLAALPEETSEWLRQLLGLVDTGVARSKGIEGASAKASAETLLELVSDPVATAVLRAMVGRTTRRHFRVIPFDRLLESKRGIRFLLDLLTLKGEDGAAPSSCSVTTSEHSVESAALLEELLMGSFSSNLVALAYDKKANFVVQRVIDLVPLAGSQAEPYARRLLELLGPHLREMAVNGIGVHVVVALVGAVGAIPGTSASLLDTLFDSVLSSSTAFDMMREQYGSLVVRKFIDAYGTRKQAKGAQLLTNVIEQNMGVLLFDPMGNLVVQHMLKALGTPAANAFARRYVKEGAEILKNSQHACASHVVFLLFDLVDGPTLTVMCTALRPHVLALAQHVNGRYIVEKAIPASRDIRDMLVRNFKTLAMSKGTQHLLCALVSNLDQPTKRTLLTATIEPSIQDLATNDCGSIALQKIMQGDEVILSAVAKYLEARHTVARDLAQNFHGKFVVQIAKHYKQ